jgi:hypothetical protein
VIAKKSSRAKSEASLNKLKGSQYHGTKPRELYIFEGI